MGRQQRVEDQGHRNKVEMKNASFHFTALVQCAGHVEKTAMIYETMVLLLSFFRSGNSNKKWGGRAGGLKLVVQQTYEQK